MVKLFGLVIMVNLSHSIKGIKETHENGNKKLTDLRRTNLLKLKETIDHNKEIFQAKVLKMKHVERLKNAELEEKKSEIESRGENPNFYLTRQAKLAKFEKQKKCVSCRIDHLLWSIDQSLDLKLFL